MPNAHHPTDCRNSLRENPLLSDPILGPLSRVPGIALSGMMPSIVPMWVPLLLTRVGMRGLLSLSREGCGEEPTSSPSHKRVGMRDPLFPEGSGGPICKSPDSILTATLLCRLFHKSFTRAKGFNHEKSFTHAKGFNHKKGFNHEKNFTHEKGFTYAKGFNHAKSFTRAKSPFRLCSVLCFPIFSNFRPRGRAYRTAAL